MIIQMCPTTSHDQARHDAEISELNGKTELPYMNEKCTFIVAISLYR